jgi:hypothetical protein
MPTRIVRPIVLGLAAALLAAGVASADTCCANTSVAIEPSNGAMPGDIVRLEKIACLAYDNSGPLELNLVGFWLSSDTVPADPNPGDVPGSDGSRLASDLPPEETWPPFASVSAPGSAGSGWATVVVPDVAAGSYQLWWRCDNGGGPGGGIHYSGGPRLTVGTAAPDTSTATLTGGAATTTAIPLLVGALAFLAVLPGWRRRRRWPFEDRRP